MASDVVVFRTVASTRVGFGHLRRCLTLADELVRRGLQPQFWIEGDDAARAVAAAAGFPVQAITADEPEATLRLAGAVKAAALIVDSYALPADYFRAVRRCAGCLLVIDDLADRALDADIVVNGSANAAELAYQLSAGCTLLLGLQFALLRPVFRNAPRRQFSSSVRRVLVTLGGADPDQVMVKVTNDVAALLPQATLDVVVGPLFCQAEVAALRQAASGTDRLVMHHAPSELFELMTRCDLAVSGGGQTLYELAACGLPTVALCLADNQRGQLAALERLGALLQGGEPGEGGEYPEVGPAVARLADDPALRNRISATGHSLVDGQGTHRVADALLKMLESGQQRSAR